MKEISKLESFVNVLTGSHDAIREIWESFITLHQIASWSAVEEYFDRFVKLLIYLYVVCCGLVSCSTADNILRVLTQARRVSIRAAWIHSIFFLQSRFCLISHLLKRLGHKKVIVALLDLSGAQNPNKIGLTWSDICKLLSAFLVLSLSFPSA